MPVPVWDAGGHASGFPRGGKAYRFHIIHTWFDITAGWVDQGRAVSRFAAQPLYKNYLASR